MAGPRAQDFRRTPGNLIRSLFSKQRRREQMLWRRLLLIARGNEDLAERLVAFELERQPWLLRHEAIEAARVRLQGDRGR